MIVYVAWIRCNIDDFRIIGVFKHKCQAEDAIDIVSWYDDKGISEQTIISSD